MPDTTVPTTALASQYIAQVDSDLERNLKEQERITAEIAALQEQLRTLEHDRSLLVNMRKSLGADAPASPPTRHRSPCPSRRPTARKQASSRGRRRPAPHSAAANQRRRQ